MTAIICSSSLRRSLPGNRFSKSLTCDMTHDLSSSSTINITDRFDTKKESINLLVKNFLHFRERILYYWPRLSLINTGDELGSEVKSIPFSFFLQLRIFFIYFRFENLTITRLDTLLGSL